MDSDGFLQLFDILSPTLPKSCLGLTVSLFSLLRSSIYLYFISAWRRVVLRGNSVQAFGHPFVFVEWQHFPGELQSRPRDSSPSSPPNPPFPVLSCL